MITCFNHFLCVNCLYIYNKTFIIAEIAFVLHQSHTVLIIIIIYSLISQTPWRATTRAATN